MNPISQALRNFKENYLAIREKLPWYDVSSYQEIPALLEGEQIETLETPERILVCENLKALPSPSSHNTKTLLRLKRSEGLKPVELAEAMAERSDLLPVIKHDQWKLSEVEEILVKSDQDFVLEAGEVKILYDLNAIIELMIKHANLCLSSFALCNWNGLERLHAAGVGERVLFGTHAPRYYPGAAMGPIILGDLPWELKCGIAGNNLRRLLGEPVTSVAEVPLIKSAPFVIDAHGHSLMPKGKTPLKFDTPDMNYSAADWLVDLDRAWVDRMVVIPNESLYDPDMASTDASEHLWREEPSRFSFYEVFHPGAGTSHIESMAERLQHPNCIGIKLHPSFHGVPADSPNYEPAYAMAEKFGLPIMSHCWEKSPTNAAQELSLPERFAVHLEKYPNTRLMLGHSGGRPGAMTGVIELAARFSGVCSDMAGDVYHSGMIPSLLDNLGPDRVLFASDMDWIDVRCNLGMWLDRDLPESDLLKVLRLNALDLFSL